MRRLAITFILVGTLILGSAVSYADELNVTKNNNSTDVIAEECETDSIEVEASREDIDSTGVFLKQTKSGRCTLAANVNMLRRDALIKGDANWSAITEQTVMSSAWINGVGVRQTYSYNGAQVMCEEIKNLSADQKTAHLISALSAHPEGVVIYVLRTSGGYPHAVLLTDYTDGVFYCADPATNVNGGRIALSASLIPTVANVNQYWYVSNSGQLYEVCESDVQDDGVGIKGKCQIPYTGTGGGYLIGFESYDNPNQSYSYEMLILDCTLLAQGLPAWVYTTGRCSVESGNALWTVWQPQYGYYWTLFRLYDENGNIIDEQCYGFENI